MTSSTEVLNTANFRDYSSDFNNGKDTSNLKQDPVITEDVQKEIDDLLECVPQLNKTFTIINKIGAGTFSSVYLATLKSHPELKQKFALKHIIPTSHPSRIENELRCLQQIGGHDNVMGVQACLRERDHVVIVMPYFPHDKFQDYVQTVTLSEVRDYMWNLMTALRRVHDMDIIHRDVKPSNFLCNRKLNKFALVDFGLAQEAPVPLKKDASSQAKSCKVKSNKSTPETQTTKVPLSPRSLNCTSKEIQASSPRKRKINVDGVENLPESPKKRRALGEPTHTGLIEVDMNSHNQKVTGSSQESMAKDEMSQKLRQDFNPPPSGLFKPSNSRFVKSPRRQLLTKRAIDTQKQLLFSPSAAQVANKKTPVVVEKDGKQMYRSVAPTACLCFNQPMICSICTSRSSQVAPRAGTPGFRSPEVLMKCPDQTTAVDIWSAGVIFLSLLSGRYPFFRAGEDMTALGQIISIFGSEEVQAAAKTIGKNVICNPVMPGFKLRTLCEKLRGVSSTKCGMKICGGENHRSWTDVSDHAYSLLARLLDLCPSTRITAEESLRHPFFKNPSQTDSH